MMAAALWASCLPPAMAGDTTSPTDAVPLHLTLAQAIGEALQANPGLRTAGHQAYAAADEASAVARSRLGGLNAVGSYSYLNDDQIIRPMSSELMVNGIVGAPWDRSQAHYGVSYEIPLYLGGQLNNQIQIAKLEARKSAELLEGTRWQVRFNVVSLYSTVQALDQTETALDEQIAALAQTKTNLDKMVPLGKRPDVDRLKMIEDLEAAKASRASAGADRRRVARCCCPCWAATRRETRRWNRRQAAQISNLLYRRLPAGRAPNKPTPRTLQSAGGLEIRIISNK